MVIVFRKTTITVLIQAHEGERPFHVVLVFLMTLNDDNKTIAMLGTNRQRQYPETVWI